MNPLKSWLGITPLEARMMGADSAINQAFIHIEELRGHIEKLSEIVLKHEARIWEKAEVPSSKKKDKKK